MHLLSLSKWEVIKPEITEIHYFKEIIKIQNSDLFNTSDRKNKSLLKHWKTFKASRKKRLCQREEATTIFSQQQEKQQNSLHIEKKLASVHLKKAARS